MNRISRPLLDRMDLCVRVDPPDLAKAVKEPGSNTGSAAMHQAVLKARQMQEVRYGTEGGMYNAYLTPQQIRTYCGLGASEEALLNRLTGQYDMSARVRQKVLKVARTIADLEGEASIGRDHLYEAVCFRMAVQDFGKAGQRI